VIALACMPAKDAVQLAVDTNNIDIILTGFKHQGSGLPATIKKSSMIYVEDEGRILGELRFIVGKGEGDVKPLNHILTRNVPDDPELAAFIARARVEISAVQNEIAKGNGIGSARAETVRVANYIGSQNCAECHQAEFDAWAKSKHAHAIDILKKEKKEFDTVCVVCHVTGSGQAGGFADLYKTPQMANVQCEACHGPGRQHSLKPLAVRTSKTGPQHCVGCHTKGNSPEFDFASYWEKIKH